MKNRFMGRLLLMLFIPAFAFAFAACAGQGGPDAPSQADTQAPSGGQEAPSGLTPVRIGFPSGGGDWPGTFLGVASEYGYLEYYLNPLGYTADLRAFVGAAPAIHEALVSDELDYVVYAGMASVLSKSNGIGHTLLSVAGWGSNWKLVARPDIGIESLSDLRGKKIAYTRGASPHMYAIRALSEGGLSFDDIEPINSTIPEGLAGIVSKTLDATVVIAGQEAELIASGAAKVIHSGFTANPDVYYEPMVFIGRTDAYEADPQVAVAIQKALLRAKDKAKSDVDAYFALQAERSGYPLEVILETAERDLDVSGPMNLDARYINSLKAIESFLRENELISGTIDYEAWVDDYVVKTAEAEYAAEIADEYPEE
ncbi:MAG: ABC transporter substrate-binding protein [Clostridiales Family XIII bacterium]|jgi:sulfonate transport system substrate-binding protein|nr:ABC transporter substrate-binding protein [Clostridiales Family XIII bacterium]